MHRISLIAIMMLLFGLAGNTALGAAKIAVDEYNYSAGNIMQGKAIDHDFTIKNTGDDPLILELNSCDSCTGFKVTAPVGPIEPGKSDKIHIRIPTYNMRGNYKREIDVKTNDPDRKNIKLAVQAYIQEALSITPEYISLGQIKTETKYQKIITMKNSSSGTVNIPEIEVEPADHLSLSPKGGIAIKPGEKKTVLVTISAGKDPGAVEGSILIRTDLKQMPQKLIPVNAEILGKKQKQ